jgi:hypothetical protein
MITTTNKQEEVDASIESKSERSKQTYNFYIITDVNQLTIRKPNVVDKETPPKSDVNISGNKNNSLIILTGIFYRGSTIIIKYTKSFSFINRCNN